MAAHNHLGPFVKKAEKHEWMHPENVQPHSDIVEGGISTGEGLGKLTGLGAGGFLGQMAGGALADDGNDDEKSLKEILGHVAGGVGGAGLGYLLGQMAGPSMGYDVTKPVANYNYPLSTTVEY